MWRERMVAGLEGSRLRVVDLQKEPQQMLAALGFVLQDAD
jgi:hypothetical protein